MLFHASSCSKLVFSKSSSFRIRNLSNFRKATHRAPHSPTQPSDLQESIKYDWDQLEAKNILKASRPKELKNTRELPPHQWSSSTWRLVEDIAIQRVAATRKAYTLYACLLCYIKQQNSKGVIDLYERFMMTLGSQESTELQSNQERSDECDMLAIAAAETKSRSQPFHPTRVRVLLAVITAYAMEGSFIGALQACLSTSVRFQSYTTQGFLAELHHDPNLRDRVRGYVERLELARLVARQKSLSRQIANLAQAGDIIRVADIYEDVIQGISQTDPYIAASENTNLNLPVAMSEIGWTAFLAGFLQCGRRDLASRLWKDLKGHGILPTIGMWTTILDSFDAHRERTMAVAAWHTMISEGISPDALSYRAIISVLFKDRHENEAMAKFKEFRQYEQHFSTPQNLAVYNSVINGLLHTKSLPESLEIFTKMKQDGPQPDVITYNTFLAYFHRRGDFKGLSNIMNDMVAENVKGDVFTFSTILSALLRVGRKDAAEVVLKNMEQQGIQPNVVTFTTLIEHQLKGQTEACLRAAFAILDKMEADPTIRPNEVTYTSILTGLYRGQWLSRSKAAMYKKEVIRRMKTQNIRFGLPTYHLILKACFESRDEDAVKYVLGYYEEMKRRRIRLAQATWYILLAGLVGRQEWGIAREIVNEMTTLGIEPSASISRLITEIKGQTC